MRIKSIAALFMVIVLLFSLSVGVLATDALTEDIVEDDEYESDEIAKELHSVYSCIYDPNSEQITVEGTVPHDLFIKYSDYSIRVYKILPFDEESSEADSKEPQLMASSEMTIKFHFAFHVDNVLDVFSKYIVMFVSDSGVVDYIGPELYPQVYSNYTVGEKSFYKGLTLEDNIPYVKADASTYILPIEYDRLFNVNLGYLYMLGKESFFFDRDYLDIIDSQIRTLSSCGSRVYLQLIMPEDESSDGKYTTLSFSEKDTIKRMYACFNFLSERYSSETNGKITGVILGKKLDSFVSNSVKGYDIDTYSQNLAIWGIIAGCAVRQNIPSADIVYSFSNLNSFDGRSVQEYLGYQSNTVIEKMSEFFDSYYSGGFDFSLMIESDINPFNITAQSISNGVNIENVPDSTYISPQTANLVSKYLRNMGEKYASSPKSFIYYWEANGELNSDAVNAIYAYSYYKLINNARVSSFVADFGDIDREVFSESLAVFKDIDSDLGSQRTEKVLKLFGISEWKDIISEFDNENLISNSLVRAEPLLIKTKNMKGSFGYFDCVDNTKVLPWRKGLGCESLSIAYNEIAGRALKAHFIADSFENGEYSYLIYKDEYPENYAYTQYLSFTLNIESDDKSGAMPYEVKITIGEGKNVIECSQAVISGEKTEIVFDVSEFSKDHLGDYIKVAVRPLSDSNSEYSLYLSSVVGLSDEYSSDELGYMIHKERLKIRDELFADDGANNKKISAAAVILVIGIIVGATLFIFLRHEDEPDKKTDRK